MDHYHQQDELAKAFILLAEMNIRDIRALVNDQISNDEWREMTVVDRLAMAVFRKAEQR